MKKKITDKMRLDFLEKLAQEGPPQGFFCISPNDGSIRRRLERCVWDDLSQPTIRAAIDAAMRRKP